MVRSALRAWVTVSREVVIEALRDSEIASEIKMKAGYEHAARTLQNQACFGPDGECADQTPERSLAWFSAF